MANKFNINRISQFPATSESGKVAEYSISLSAAPKDNVTIQFTSGNTAEGKVNTPSLTFTQQNWSTAQSLYIQGVDDFFDDGNVSYSLTGKVVTKDRSYKDTPVPVINLTNLDDGLDTPIYFDGTKGVDIFTGNNGNDRIYGGLDQDQLKGGRGNDFIYGQEDDDRLFGELGDDKIYGGYGNDYLDAGIGNDSLFGELGRDSLIGGNGNDFLNGDDGNDYLDGGLLNDTMSGGEGNDTYLVDSTGDQINDLGATTDVDTVIITQTITYTLSANIENASVNSMAGNGNLTGNTLNNGLTGNANKNILDGAAGADSLNGGAGIDSLNGGAGNDTLAGCFFGANGGRGERDTLVGGTGNDIFQLGWSSGRFYDDGNTANAGRTDYILITDFTVGQDKLQLDGAAAGYYLAASGVTGVTGTGLYAEQGATDELIAIVRSANSTAMSASNTINTALFI